MDDKRPMRFILHLLPILLLGACSDSAIEGPPDDTNPPVDTPNPVTTMELVPSPIVVSLDDLPDPYATASAVNRADIAPVPTSPLVYAPAGFKVNVFASGLTVPRSLALAPNGDVFVAESGANTVRVLRDSTGNGDADLKRTFADGSDGLARPFGLVFAPGYVYIASATSVRRFSYQAGQLEAGDTSEIITTLTSLSGHWTRDLALSLDGNEMYISIGSASNASVETSPRATVQRMQLDGSGRRTMASGLRNPVGLAVHPLTGTVYTVVNERDGLGDDLVPDFMAALEQGDFYGWPYTYLSPDRLDPRRMNGGVSESPSLAATTKTPAVLFEAHSAPLGLVFYDGDSFPARYKNGAFVAFHGSWNRKVATGYKVVFVPFGPDGMPTGGYEDFLTGFLVGETNSRAWARPVDLVVMPDGSMLVSDDANGMIYRIQYYQ